MAVPTMGRWYNPMGSPCLMVQWDGMDRWDGCPSHGTVVQSHGIPMSRMVPGVAHMYQMDKDISTVL